MLGWVSELMFRVLTGQSSSAPVARPPDAAFSQAPPHASLILLLKETAQTLGNSAYTWLLLSPLGWFSESPIPGVTQF